VAKRALSKVGAKDYSADRSQGSKNGSIAVKEPPVVRRAPPKIDAPSRTERVEQGARKAVEAPKKPFVENYELPSSYNTTSLTLIARDPFWIYAYWETSPASVNDARNRIGEGADAAKYVLRMYDVSAIDFNGTNARNTFDIEVGPNTANWYVNLWTDNASFCAEHGLRMPDGKFYAFVRSNFITTPRANPSGRSEQIWMDVKDSSSHAPFVVGDIQRSASGAAQAGKARGINKKKYVLPKAKRWRKILLSDADIRAYYARLSPRLKDIISNKLARKYENKKFGSGRVYVDVKGNRIVLEDFLVKGLSRGQFIKRLLSGASEELVFLGASEAIFSGASEQSPGAGKGRKFFFELGTELIVYGRTEPDAEVWMLDKKIDLRSDGTFSLRFALPDGKIPLDFAAISNDKVERREISTSVERRKTLYNP